MSPSEAKVVVIPPWMKLREGTRGVAANRTMCPGIQPGEPDATSHTLDIGDPVIVVAGAWRCQKCAERIRRRDP